MIETPKEIQRIIDKMPDHWFDWSHEEKIDATFDRQLARSLGKIEEAGRRSAARMVAWAVGKVMEV